MNNNLPPIYLSEVDSTNAELRRRLVAQPDLPHGTVVVADYQTAGRGQRGNVWESRAGENLLFSIFLRPEHLQAAQAFLLSQQVSLALVGVLSGYLPQVSIKWPNDIYCGDRKLAGILIENDVQGDEVSCSIVGIGLNVNQEEFHSSAPNPVSMRRLLGRAVDREKLLVELTDALLRSDEKAYESRYRAALYRGEGFYPYFDTLKQEKIRAEIVAVSPTGCLTLRTDRGEMRRFFFKEIEYIQESR